MELTGGADGVSASANQHALAVEAGVEVSHALKRLALARLRLDEGQEAKAAAGLCRWDLRG
jgi:hypothetical protein